jgi:hypothetical protein
MDVTVNPQVRLAGFDHRRQVGDVGRRQNIVLVVRVERAGVRSVPRRIRIVL